MTGAARSLLEALSSSTPRDTIQENERLVAEEAAAMTAAPRAGIAAFMASAAAAEPERVCKALERDGCARVNQALSAETAGALLAHVNAVLEERSSGRMGFEEGELLGPNRYDLQLGLEPLVCQALAELLSPVRPLFSAALGEDAELYELAALVSDPGSPRQPVHADFPALAHEDSPAIMIAFAALQDVAAEMGPTSIVPRTHTAEAHAHFNSRDGRLPLLREAPSLLGVLDVGDANLIDARVLHCGGANQGATRRVLFYCSFRRRGKVTAGTRSLLYELEEAGLTLNNVVVEERARSSLAPASADYCMHDCMT